MGEVIRKMAPGDVARVAQLEVESFTCPWTADSFAHLLERDGCELWVLDDREAGVVGYGVLWCILDQGELANFAVAPSHRGKGHGARLLARMLKVAREREVERIYLEVRVSNAAAIGLYRGFGFTDVGRRKKYYDKPVEDALIMVLEV
ncbi:MAG: ribosomal protein S18-alanine N-acetyltransferase [Longimicrobiales bacterium]